MSSDAAAWLEQKRNSVPELASVLAEASDCLEKRLWHQLTQQLVALFSNPYFNTPTPTFTLDELFNKFVAPIAEHLHLLSVAQFAERAAAGMSAESALQLLQAALTLVEQDKEAKIYINSTIATVQTTLGKLHTAAAVLSKCDALANSANQVLANAVLAHLHGAHAKLARAQKDTAGYAQHAILHLTYADLAHAPAAEREELARDLALAAALSDKHFSLGECLQHPALAALDPQSPLPQLLLALNYADFALFEQVMARPDLPEEVKQHQRYLELKLRLLALAAFVHSRPSSQRVVSLADLAAATRCSELEAQRVVITAIGNGLVRARIDDVEGQVAFAWVTPRALDRAQLEGLAQSFKSAVASVADLAKFGQASLEQHRVTSQ